MGGELTELYEMLGVNNLEQAKRIIMQTQLQLAMISEEKPLVGALAINRRNKQIVTTFTWGKDKLQDMRDMLEALRIVQTNLFDRMMEMVQSVPENSSEEG